MRLKSVRDANFSDQRVLCRVDFNVPLKDGQVGDDTRIRAALPTLAYMLEQGARVILCSHLGRPKGVDDKLRLDPIAPVLEKLLNAELEKAGLGPISVLKLADCVGPEVEVAVAASGPAQVVLLENLRFHPEEEQNDPAFAAQLARLADVYVSDAFGTVHRAHASTEGVAHILPAYAGFLVEKEVSALAAVIADPKRPLVIVMGGAKISGKIEVLENLLPKADTVLIGGAMANTFLKATGREVGKSLVEDGMLDTARAMLELAKKSGTEFLLPVDYVVTDDVKNPTRVEVKAFDGLSAEDCAADIGPRTIENFRRVIAGARTVFWNGPMGVFETPQFAAGTLAVARALAAVYGTAHTVVGGGESVDAVNQAGVAARIHHVSTGGGASLEFVAGMELPGVKVLLA